MRWGQCTLQELRRREPPQNPRPVADKPRSRQRERGESARETGEGTGLGDDSPGSSAEGTMQFAIWLVGLMCHLSTLVRDTLPHRLHPKQGRIWFMIVCGAFASPASFVSVSRLLCDRILIPSFCFIPQRAWSSSCHRMKLSPRSVWMTSENLSPTSCTTGGDGGV